MSNITYFYIEIPNITKTSYSSFVNTNISDPHIILIIIITRNSKVQNHTISENTKRKTVLKKQKKKRYNIFFVELIKNFLNIMPTFTDRYFLK